MPLRLIKSLGSGGFGNVDLVEADDGERFARKTFSVNQPLNSSLVDNVKKRFVREARVQKGLSHRNIVPVVGEDLSSEPPFFLMPRAESSLAADVQNDRSLGGRWVGAVMDIISGLEELHSLGMCHRDLKPENVLRFQDEKGSFYAVGDFGFISLKDTRFSALTSTGMARGSDFYTAPEVVTDLRNASAQSDIFSLGCIIHELVGREDRIPCHEIREDGPFGGVLLGCTRQDHNRRFKSVRAVADALLSIEEDAQGFSSPQAEALGGVLEADGSLTIESWRGIIEYLDGNRTSQEKREILFKLSQERISEICSTFPQEANRLGGIFANWVVETSFNFETCDTIAARTLTFIQSCSFDVKVDCLLALLDMGTSHNRWYVERMFMGLCGADMDPALARRLSVEFRVSGPDICRRVDHLERSIGANRENLHPELVKTLKDICP